jgi:hypothetical protein
MANGGITAADGIDVEPAVLAPDVAPWLTMSPP